MMTMDSHTSMAAFTHNTLDQLAEHAAWICIHSLEAAGLYAGDRDKLASSLTDFLRERLGIKP